MDLECINPGRKKILFISQKNFAVLRGNKIKMKALIIKIEPLKGVIDFLFLPKINELVPLFLVIQNILEDFHMFSQKPDR
jgi:hypothetical protein